ncbi:MAG: ABC transporter permease, partial [Gammaproteobacteria bacterium]
MTGTLYRASWRHLWRHPLQLALAVLGIALGVAVVVAVDLANDSARRGFALAMDSTAGRATHQIIGGPTGLDEAFYSKLRVALGMRDSAPVVEAFGRTHGETIQLLGVDPLAESPFRSHLDDTEDLPFDRLLTEPATLVMAARTAARLELKTGDEFELALAGKRHHVIVAGLLSGNSQAALDGLALADISTVQELTGHIGKLSWIDLVIPEGATRTTTLAKIEQHLPADADIVPARSRQNASTQMTGAFHTNLTAMGLLGLIVGMFLIYNTMSFTVLQRRGLLAGLRVLGVTRREVMYMILGEALLLGLAGALLGLLLGILLSHILLQLVTRTINDLYFVLTVTELRITALPLLKALALGLLSAALAAGAPALEAAGTQPRLGLLRSTLEQRAHTLAPRLAIVGVLMAIAALVLLALPTQSLVTGFTGLFLTILGLTFMTPLVVAAGSALLARAINRHASVQARLAVRGIGASLSRTGVAIAALTLAVSTSVGVGVMIDSFRSSVSTWLAASLRADIYVTTPSFGSNRTQAELDPSVPALLRDIAGLEHVSTGRSVEVESENGVTEILALATAADRAPRYPLKTGAAQTVWPAFTRG